MQDNFLNKLKKLYLLAVIIPIILILPTHIFPQPYFMPLRFPHYLEKMDPLLGISWPLSFEIYHWILIVLPAFALVNIIGIIKFPKFKFLAIFSSFFASLLTFFMIVFFLFIFLPVNTSTGLIFGILSVFLFFVNLLTFIFLLQVKERKNPQSV